ncbi:MAG: hypothetical protein V9G14_04255 [Cypionkella sp.]
MYEAIRRQAEDRKAGRDGESYVFFVGRENYPLAWVEGAQYPWGKAQVLREGSDVVLVGTRRARQQGDRGRQATCGRQGIQATVINNPFVNRPDLETIGAAVEALRRPPRHHRGPPGRRRHGRPALPRAEPVRASPTAIRTLGIHGEFGQSAYLAEQLYEKYGLTGPKMAEAATKLVRG